MKRKIYTTDRERKTDQIIGFVAFPLLNIVFWFVTDQLLAWAAVVCQGSNCSLAQACILLMPWIINGIVIALAFLFRPAVGDGYVTCIGVALFTPMLLGAIFMAACFTAAVANVICSSQKMFILVFFGLMSIGVLWLGWRVLVWVAAWWRRE